MKAVIVTGGKQYTVAEGDVLFVEKLGVEAGEMCVFEDALYSIKSAKAAGCPVMAIQEAAQQNTWEEIKALSDHWFEDYGELL